MRRRLGYWLYDVADWFDFLPHWWFMLVVNPLIKDGKYTPHDGGFVPLTWYASVAQRVFWWLEHRDRGRGLRRVAHYVTYR